MFIYALNEFYSYEGVCGMFNILMVKIEGQDRYIITQSSIIKSFTFTFFFLFRLFANEKAPLFANEKAP